MKAKNINRDIIKRVSCERRNEEIALHGKQICFRPIKTKSKKTYTRKEKHKTLSPYFFYLKVGF